MNKKIQGLLAKDKIKALQEYNIWKKMIDNMRHQMYSIPEDIIIDETRISEKQLRIKYWRKYETYLCLYYKENIKS